MHKKNGKMHVSWSCRGTTNAVTLLLLLKLTWLTKQSVLQHRCTDILLSWRDKNYQKRRVVLLYYYCVFNTMPGSLSPFLYISNILLSLPHPFFLLSLSLLFFFHSPHTTPLYLEGLFEFGGYCVRRCPQNYFSREGQCIPCDEPCPRGRRVPCSHGNQTSFMLP